MKNSTIMILSESSDKSTDLVCHWLHHWNVPFLRLNKENEINPIINIEYSNTCIKVHILKNGTIYDFSNIKKTWFRRGYFLFRYIKDIPTLPLETNKSIKEYLACEGKTIENYLYYYLNKGITINYPSNYNYNKLIALNEAQKVGLLVPQFLLSVNPDKMKAFVFKEGDCISKSIQDMNGIEINNTCIFIGNTIRVDTNSICPRGHWYSLLQKEIKKKYELRIFYFKGKIYTMAIFSQMNEDSYLDFRDVDVNGPHPNRMVPYNLSAEMAGKIRKLMRNLKLESGSIDIIVDKNNKYYFLEVNPVGQFNFVSEICNYNIEKDIANFLAK